MKKIIYFILLLFVLFRNGYSEKLWTFKSGANISHIFNTDNSRPFLSYSIGIEVKIKIIIDFSINPEILFSRQNSEINNYFISSFGYDISANFDYIILKRENYHISARLSPSFHDFDYQQTNYYYKNTGETDCAPRSAESVSINIGAVYTYKRFSFEIRYMHNLEEIDQHYYTPNHYKIHSLHFLLGLIF